MYGSVTINIINIPKIMSDLFHHPIPSIQQYLLFLLKKHSHVIAETLTFSSIPRIEVFMDRLMHDKDISNDYYEQSESDQHRKSIVKH